MSAFHVECLSLHGLDLSGVVLAADPKTAKILLIKKAKGRGVDPNQVRTADVMALG
jgi:hypothetical protein